MSLVKNSNTKRFLALFLLIITIFTILTTTCPIAFADDPSDADGDGIADADETSFYERLKYLQDADSSGWAAFAWEFGCIAKQGHPEYSFVSVVSGIFTISRWDYAITVPDGGGTKTITVSIEGAGAALYQAMKVAGLVLIMLYFLIEILDEIQADNFNVEHLVKKLITLAIAIIVLNQGDTLFSQMCNIADAFIEDAVTASADGAIASSVELELLYDTLVDACGDGGLLSIISVVFQCLAIISQNAVPYALSMVAFIIAYFVSFSRYMEILVRYAFAPVGMAQLVSGGSKGPGMRYIKKFASCLLQGAVCVLGFGTVAILSNLGGPLDAAFGQIIIPLTLIGFVTKSGKYADDIMGV